MRLRIAPLIIGVVALAGLLGGAPVGADGSEAINAGKPQIGEPPTSQTSPFQSALLDAVATPRVDRAGALAPHMEIDNASRNSVRNAYNQWFLKDIVVPAGWNGNRSTCTPGMPSTAGQNATLSMVNYFREMVGVEPARFDAGLSVKAQKAALIMDANSSLSHYPPSNWACWSEEGAEAAGNSNLALGAAGADAVSLYMEDPGWNNTSVGHRRWVTSPDRTLMGAGSTNDANALWVLSEPDEAAYVPTIIAWPTAGYFPSPLEPRGRWSLTIPGADFFGPDPFANVSVSVRETTGTAHDVTIVDSSSGYGMGATIVFEVKNIKLAKGHADTTFRVTLTGLDSPGFPSTYTYYVTMIDPATTPLANGVYGAVEGISLSGNKVKFYGKAKGVGTQPTVVISRNGKTLGTLVATRPRLDDMKGWQYEASISAGTYKYCAHFANPSAPGGWTVDCRTVVK